MTESKVDVLRLMDDAATWKGDFAGDFFSAAEMRTARAAVAELIEANQAFDVARKGWSDGDRYEWDNYGVYGSDFKRCLYCENESGAGILNKGVSHEPDCKVDAIERAEKRRDAALAACTPANNKDR